MKKFAVCLLLLTACVIFLGGISVIAIDHGHGFNIEELFSSAFNVIAGLLCVASSMLLYRWLSYLESCDQIAFSFFFFGWRNSNHEETSLRLNRLFPNLETSKGF